MVRLCTVCVHMCVCGCLLKTREGSLYFPVCIVLPLYLFSSLHMQQMFQARDKTQQLLVSTQNTLVKKKDSEMKLKAQGKPDKIAAIQAEIEAVCICMFCVLCIKKYILYCLWWCV